ncbi:MAG: YgjV family protein, partial [Methanobrevibacter sp.]|nr:YgjV family protein [Methanobrevibacter sp.]
ICNYYLKSIKSIKTSFIVKSAFYIVYFLAIYDFSSFAFESITVIIGLISLFKFIFADKDDERLTEN